MSVGEKQGHLADLHTKSKVELLELIKRQEKLVANVAFVKKLPDKGAKIHAMINKIQSALKQLVEVDETADLFEKLAIQSEQARQQRIGWDGMEMDEQGEKLMRQLASRGQQGDKVVKDERTPEPDLKFINSYEKVIKKAEQRSIKSKFRPNRSIRTKDVQSLSEKMSLVSLKSDRKVVLMDKPVMPPGGRDTVALDEPVMPPGGRDIIALDEPVMHPGGRDIVALDEPVMPPGGRDIVTLDEPVMPPGETLDATKVAPGERHTLTNQITEQSQMEQSNKECLMHSDENSEYTVPEKHSKLSPPKNNSLNGVSEKGSDSPGVSANVVPTKPLKVPASNSLSDHAEARGKLKYKYDELIETNLYTGKCRHPSAMMISIEESAMLQTSQQKTVQEIQARSAAEKLSERLNIKMDQYLPEGSSATSYREQHTVSDDDRDSDDEELDYPD